MINTKVDVLVLGGGLVGLTTALLCAKHLSVAVVEANPAYLTKTKLDKDKDKDKDKEELENKYDNRVYAITRSSQRVFESLGIWELINAHSPNSLSVYHKMKVWDALGFGEICFDAKDINEQDLGHIIENRILSQALWKKVKDNERIQIFQHTKPVSISDNFLENNTVHNDKLHKEKNGEFKIIHLENGQKIAAKLIIGCDGAKSWLRNTLKIETQGKSYHQSALVATVVTEKPHAQTAWQRFLPEGPLAFLPLSQPHYASIVWSAKPETINDLLTKQDAEFCKHLGQAFDYRLGHIKNVWDRLSFPLNSLRAKSFIDSRAVLVGDAAHVIHPLAGQGVNLGLNDAKTLAAILEEAFQKNYDIGDPLILRRYERARKGETIAMLALMDFFKHAFEGTSSTKAILRSLGVTFINNSFWFKKKIIQYAMGIA